MANARVRGTTERLVAAHFAEERASLRGLPAGPFNATLKLERRISREGLISIGGNRYSVPDGTRACAVEVHTLAQELRIFEVGQLIAVHPLLQGRRQCSILPSHRSRAIAIRLEPLCTAAARGRDGVATFAGVL